MKKLSFVTGASRGLGAALADQLSAKGHEVVRLSSRDMDLSEPIEAEKKWAEVLGRYQAADYSSVLLVNNAGLIEPVSRLENVDVSALAKCMAVNATSVIALTARFLKFAQGTPQVVVNISSGVATQPLVGWEAYSASKAALENFSKALVMRAEADSSLRAINFNPGIVDTDMQGQIRGTSAEDFAGVERFKQFKEDGDLRSPEQVALAIVNCVESGSGSSFTSVNEWV